MRRHRIRIAAIAVAMLAAVSLAACSSSSSTSRTSSASTPAGKPVFGGTLRFLSAGDFDHIDTLSGYCTSDVQIASGRTPGNWSSSPIEQLQHRDLDRPGHRDRGADQGERRAQR